MIPHDYGLSGRQRPGGAPRNPGLWFSPMRSGCLGLSSKWLSRETPFWLTAEPREAVGMDSLPGLVKIVQEIECMPLRPGRPSRRGTPTEFARIPGSPRGSRGTCSPRARRNVHRRLNGPPHRSDFRPSFCPFLTPMLITLREKPTTFKPQGVSDETPRLAGLRQRIRRELHPVRPGVRADHVQPIRRCGHGGRLHRRRAGNVLLAAPDEASGVLTMVSPNYQERRIRC